MLIANIDQVRGRAYDREHRSWSGEATPNNTQIYEGRTRTLTLKRQVG